MYVVIINHVFAQDYDSIESICDSLLASEGGAGKLSIHWVVGIHMYMYINSWIYIHSSNNNSNYDCMELYTVAMQ